MNFKDLITDGSGKISHHKVWGNIANFVATGGFIYEVVADQDTEWLWLIYLGVVGGSQLVSQMLKIRYGGATPTPSNTSTTMIGK